MGEKRAQELVSLLNLAPHPEGGYYREMYRSETSAATHIYYLLTQGLFSRWHQIDSDEIWNHYEGDPLELIWFKPGDSYYEKQILGPLTAQSSSNQAMPAYMTAQAIPVHVIPAGAWQAAHPLGSYTLTGCTVAPGFEFSRFRLLSESESEAEALKRRWPELARFL